MSKLDHVTSDVSFASKRSSTGKDSSLASIVNVRPLKKFAAEKLGHQSALRDVLLAEKDEMPRAEFLAKLGVWLLLARRGEE